MEEFQLALKYHPDNFKAHSKLGLVFSAMGKIDKAEKEWEKVLALNPNYVKAYINLGTLYYLHKKDRNKALEFWEKALDISPQDAKALNNIGNYYRDKKELIKAATYYQRAVALKPTSTLMLNNLAYIFLDMGKVEKAEKVIFKSKEIKPDAPVTNFILGKLYHQKKDFDKAIQAYNHVVSISPGFAEPYYEIATIYFNNKKEFIKAESMLKKALELKPNEENFNTLFDSIKSKLKIEKS